jgi:hypothetical protein
MPFRANKLIIYAILCFVSMCGYAQTHLVLCAAGIGSFSSKFTTGVAVTVAATKVRGFSTRTCEATLGWGEEVMPAAQEAWEIDIDVLGADLGLNTPVVAFQVKSSAQDHLMTYKVYSLEKPPRLLRTITGGDWFEAAHGVSAGRLAGTAS